MPSAPRLFAEAFGTFCLVFAGTGAIVVNAVTSGSIGHVGISLTFGLVVLAMILALAPISGAHLNPAVSLALACAKRFPARDVPLYILAQLVGAFAASALLRLLFPTSPTLGETLPAGAPWQSFTLEAILTCILMLVILAVSSQHVIPSHAAALAIGGTVALEALFAGPISGASMNPARSVAPAIINANSQSLWLYLLAPTLGALFALPLASALRLTPRQRTSSPSA